MKHSFLPYLFAAVLLCSCVENQLPEPVYVPEITSLAAEGAISVTISAPSRTVLLDMEETSNLGSVKITSCNFNNPSLVKPSRELVGTFDLRKPLEFTLTTYNNYNWKICAIQSISRVFTMRGQVGKTVIDEVNKRIIVTLSKAVPRSWTNVTECKLGPEGQTTYSEDPFEWKDFSTEHKITVFYRDIKEEWTIFVEQSDMAVYLKDVSPRVTECYLCADAPEGADNGFVYRLKGEKSWIEVEDLASAEGSVTGYIDALSQASTYECVAFSGTDSTDVYEFTTLEPVLIPNGDFEEISSSASGKYYEFFDPNSSTPSWRTPWWGSGNGSTAAAGSAEMGFVITVPDNEDKVSGNTSVRCQTQWAIVKLAAGNIFTGYFTGMVGTTGGKVHFGRPFTARPKALKLWYKYQNGPIDQFNGAPEGDPVKLGDPDKAQIMIALGDWDWKVYGGDAECPVEVNTTDKSTLFNPSAPAVIAYGTFYSDTKMDEWKELTIPLDYRDNFRVPTHIIISCAASYLGDYFTGYTGSKLWVDAMQLVY